LFLALLHAAVLGAALRVEGEVNCPAPAQVAADVQQILGLSDEYAPKVHATLTREGAFIRLALLESDGTSLGERLLTADEDCLVLSRTAAVVLAAWLTDQHPEFLLTLPPEAPPAAASSTPSDAGGTARQSPPPVAPAPATPPSAGRRRPETATPAPPRPRHRLALSAALGSGWASPNFVPGAWLGVSLSPARSGWGAQISVAWLGEHTQHLSRSSVSWSRWPLLVGPYLRVPTRLGILELEAGAALGWLHLKGQHFSRDRGLSTAQVGGYGALRLMPQWGAWQPFLMAAPVLWFNSVNAAATDSSDMRTGTTHLSSFEVLLAAGVRFLP
jgi:hypothetical protein